MKNPVNIAVLLVVSTLCIPAATASKTDPKAAGQVQLPLEDYAALVQQATDPTRPPRPAPAGYALGSATVKVSVSGTEARASAAIEVELAIDVLENEWVLVPVLPPGTPVESVTIGGKPVQLLAIPQGLAWSTRKSGSYTMRLKYRVDATRSDAGFTLGVPLPEAVAINLSATLPGTGLDTAVIPSAGIRSVTIGSSTQVTATVPTTSGLQISWRTPGKNGHTISRAGYSGKLVDDTVVWTGKLAVELFGDETVTLGLLPSTVTLSDLRIDGKEATILVEGKQFATLIRGRGMHSVEVVFQTPVQRADGPPHVDLEIPRIPVSRFELRLPGKKELTVTPASSVTSKTENGATLAVVHVPMTGRVSLTWSEAVPEAVKAEVRSNAATYHTVYAEEGVLYARARVMFEVNRGRTNVVELTLPADVQINRINVESGAVAITDWRIHQPEEDRPGVITVFLDRELTGPLLLDIHYDRSLRPAEDGTTTVEVPLIRALAAQRQKGMVALLANSELTLNPVETSDATKVGENQLPDFVRDEVEMTVAHTFKYTEMPARLLVEVTLPERVRGKFDARIDTLVSLGDVTLTGSATVQVNVKSGRIMELRIELPEDVSLLNLTAPSLRTYKVDDEQVPRVAVIEFTQEMEGQFRVELIYERILSDGGSQVHVPTLSVPGAEVEQGRIAVEALSAVEVLPAVTDHLSSLDINELPQQLVLQTTNPILLAYKYVHAHPKHRLALEVTRHEVLGVQEAAIDRADYRTLFTKDGLLVTTAEFSMRNSRRQFLRVRLPEESEVWSVFVDGNPQKPAIARGESDDGTQDLLIKVINSTRPFTVHLIYAQNGERIGRVGTVEGTLPDPDILVTQSRWDVFLPEGNRYGPPTTNLELLEAGSPVSPEAMSEEFARLEAATATRRAIEPLRIMVPTAGVHYAFEKVYANQAEQQAWFRLPHVSRSGFLMGQVLSLVGLALVCISAGLYLVRIQGRPWLPAAGLAVAGAAILLVALRVYHQNPMVPLAALLIFVLAFAARHGRRYIGWRPMPTPEQG